MTMTTANNVREFIPVLQFVFKHGITVEQVSTDMWKIRTANTAASGTIPGLDTSRTYPSFELAVQALVNSIDKRSSAAA